MARSRGHTLNQGFSRATIRLRQKSCQIKTHLANQAIYTRLPTCFSPGTSKKFDDLVKMGFKFREDYSIEQSPEGWTEASEAQYIGPRPSNPLKVGESRGAVMLLWAGAMAYEVAPSFGREGLAAINCAINRETGDIFISWDSLR